MSNQPHKAGRFGEIYTEEDFLNAVQRLQPAGTKEIADAVGCSRQNADYRLRQLEEEDKVSFDKIGGALVWSLDQKED